ncbi:hypothetical protein TRFO_11932 [Tritrichomonas foetus]|uniref:Protein kinase domain-containing protein n=1 Tax=Tritrichomonas foetus TaxID=1144522 RepID=A0A1J4J3J0_9EUKA|nr:hypothetical protein TRFO_11932 [Tritrichomonas foetus]|eukprot:OHS93305.1 hypothetical protein TRFO_11932 [Tritrichomonas foetus]
MSSANESMSFLDSRKMQKYQLDLSEYEGCKKLDDADSSYIVRETATRDLFILKVIDDAKYNEAEFVSTVSTLAKFNHRAILKFVGFTKKTEKQPATIMTRYINNGTLKKIISEQNKLNKEFQSVKRSLNTIKYIILYGITSALNEYRKKGIFYRGISPSNILLDDFFNPYVVYEKTKESEDEFKKNLDLPSDVFALGQIFYQLIVPKEQQKNFEYGTSPYISSDTYLSNSAKELLRCLLEDRVECRLDFNFILNFLENDLLGEKSGIFPSDLNIEEIRNYIGSCKNNFVIYYSYDNTMNVKKSPEELNKILQPLNQLNESDSNEINSAEKNRQDEIRALRLLEHQRSIRLLDEMARRNNPFALYHIGKCYRDGIIVGQDISKANDYFQKAAAQEFAPALRAQGLYFQKIKNLPKASEKYLEAAKLGDKKAQFLFAKLQYDEMNYTFFDEADQYLEESRKQNYSDAIALHARQDKDVESYEKSIEMNSVLGYTYYGEYLYATYKDNPEMVQEAIYYLYTAAANLNPDGLCCLAKIYNDNNNGVKSSKPDKEPERTKSFIRKMNMFYLREAINMGSIEAEFLMGENIESLDSKENAIYKVNLTDFEYVNSTSVKNLTESNQACKICLVKRKESHRDYYVLKILNSDDELAVKNFSREITNSLKFKFPSIVRFSGFTTADKERDLNPTILSKYVSTNSLGNVFKNFYFKNKPYQRLYDTEKYIIMYGVAAAMAEIHSHNVFHRNLVPESILLDDKLHPYLTGFERSKQQLEKIQNSLSQTSANLGDDHYKSPEMQIGKGCQTSDVYSYSIIVYEMITQTNAFKTRNPRSVCEGYTPPIPDFYSEELSLFLQSCWAFEPFQRFTFSEILKLFDKDIKGDKSVLLPEANLETVRSYQQNIKSRKVIEYTYAEDVKTQKIPKYLEKYFMPPQEKTSKREKSKKNDTENELEDENEKISIQNELEGLKLKSQNQLLNCYQFFKELAKAGDRRAQYQFGVLYRDGCCVDKNITKAEKLFRYSHENDPSYPPATEALALIFKERNDLPNAIEYFKQAASKKLPESQYQYGCILADGIGLERNPVEAARYFKYAIENGNADANAGLGELYEKGDGVPRDYAKALDCYRQAANMNSMRGCINLGRFLLKGIGGTEILVNDGIESLKKAADNEIPEALYLLGEFYHYGIVDPNDPSNYLLEPTPETSISYLTQASQLGSKEAQILLGETKESLDSDEMKCYQVDLSKYQCIGKLGKGNQGVALLVKNDTDYYALKVLTEWDRDSNFERNFSREVTVLSKLHFPSILRFIGFTKQTEILAPTILTNYISNGDLGSLLKKARSGKVPPIWTDTTKYIIILGLAAAMAEVHSHNIIHRDLKPDNVFLDDNCHPYLADFGLSKKQAPSANLMLQSNRCGTENYMAPEMIEGCEASHSSDVYSYGLIAYEVMSGKPLATTRPDVEDDPDLLQSQAEFLSFCLQYNPSERPSFSEIVNILKEGISENADFVFFDHADFQVVGEYADTLFSKQQVRFNFNDEYITAKNINKNFNMTDFEPYFAHKENAQPVVELKEEDKIVDPEEVSKEIELVGIKLKNQDLFEDCFQYFGVHADKGDKRCQYQYAILLRDGIANRNPDQVKALSYFEMSAKQKYPPSIRELAIIKERIHNLEEARKLYKEASDLGDAEAQYRYSKMLLQSPNMKKDPVGAFKYLSLARKQNHAEATNALGQLYENGEGVEKDLISAFNCYNQASTQFSLKAQYNLARCLLYEIGTTQDTQKALGYLYDASSKDLPEALYLLGLIYQKGFNGIEPNDTKSLRYLQRAVRLGSIEAMTLLGETQASLDSEELLPYILMPQEYDNLGRLGRGQYGSACLVRQKTTGDLYVIKLLNNYDEKYFAREVTIMSRLSFPSILRLTGFTKSCADKSIPASIMTEYVPNGDLGKLLEKVHKNKAPNEWNDTTKYIILLGLAAAMAEVHSHNILHRDLKPDNILLDNDYYPYLADFGLSKRQVEEEDGVAMMQTGQVGTVRYMAPEMMEEKSTASQKTDVYSYGIIAYEIVTGKEAWANVNGYRLMTLIQSGDRPEINPEIAEKYPAVTGLIENCWAQSASDRIPFSMIVDVMSEDISGKQSDVFPEAKMEIMQSYLQIIQERIHVKPKYNMNELPKLRVFKEDNKYFESTEETLETNRVIEGLKLEKQSRLVECFNHFMKLAEEGDKCGQYHVGRLYRDGIGQKVNKTEAEKYLKLSAEQNYGPAIEALALLYEAKQQFKIAIQYFQKAADMKLKDSLYHLGRYYANPDFHLYFTNSEGKQEDANILYKKAAKLFGDAKEQVHGDAIAALGVLHEFGYGIPQDLNIAFNYYNQSAHMNSLLGHINLGRAFVKGIGTEVDYTQAIEELSKAIPSQDPEVFYLLGLLYKKGQGCQQNQRQSVSYLRKAADLGSYDAQTLLGETDNALDSEDLKLYKLNLSEYENCGLINQGTYGRVYLVKNRINHQYMALKIIKLYESRSFAREVTILSKLHHPSILRFIGFTKEDEEKNYPPTIMTEYIPSGNLGTVLSLDNTKLQKKCLDDTEKYIILYGIASSMAEVHAHNILHRDLKPENIFVDAKYEPYLADFGLSKLQVDEGFNPLIQTGTTGTPYYTAPEMIEEARACQGSDVYSFAIIAFELITGKRAWPNIRNHMTLKNIVTRGGRPEFPVDLEVNLLQKTLVNNCWNQDISARPSFESIVQDFDEDIASGSPKLFEKADVERLQEYVAKNKSRKPVKVNMPQNFKEPLKYRNDYKELFELNESSSDSRRSINVSIAFIMKSREEEALKLEHQGRYEECFQEFSRLAESSDEWRSKYHLGRLYRDGIGCKVDLEKAKVYFEIAAAQHYGPALLALGQLYEDAKDFTKAIKYYKDGAEMNTDCMFKYGRLLVNCPEIERNPNEAAAYFSKAANQNHGDSIASLGELYERGEGVKKDLNEAISLYTKASDLGSALGHANIGRCYIKGIGTEKDIITGIDKLRVCISKNENAEILYFLGRLYLTGDVESDFSPQIPMAIKYLIRAAEKGSLQAIVSLGELYEMNGQAYKALELYRHAETKKFAPAITHLGGLYLHGVTNAKGTVIIQRDVKKAIALFKKVRSEDPDAVNALGRLKESGTAPMVKNEEEAFSYFKEAYEHGSPGGAVSYALFLSVGKHCEKDATKALDILKKAADTTGDLSAILSYARMLYSGTHGIKKNYRESIRYFQNAIKRGVKQVNLNVGIMYGRGGHGINPDRQQMMESFKSGAEAGVVQCMERLSKKYEETKDPENAQKYFLMAAKSGSKYAKKKLKKNK